MTLDFNDNHEITLSILHEDQPYLLWSSGVRFVFVMRGTVSALLHGQTHTLSTGWLLSHPSARTVSNFLLCRCKALMVYIRRIISAVRLYEQRMGLSGGRCAGLTADNLR